MGVLAADVDHIGLQAFQATGIAMTRPHLHPELEFNLLVSGSAAYESSRGRTALPLGRLVVFWGGYPHQLIGSGPLEMIGVTLPLSDAGRHPALTGPARTLLSGQWLVGSAQEGPADTMMLGRWNAELRGRPTPAVSDICLLEMQARLARLGGSHAPSTVGDAPSVAAERLLTVVARHFAEPMSVSALAARAKVHPTYAAKVFTETFDMPMWRYVEKLRIAHAQRLLRTTNWPVDRIAHECGYRTRSGFYRAFTATCGRSPAQFRRG